MKPELTLVAKTLSGLEGVLAGELKALGAKDAKPYNRVVAFTGDRRLLYKANLCCRTAIRILVRIRKFNVADEQHLYDEIREVDWSQHMDARGTLAIDPVVSNSTFKHSLYVAQKAKDAIADQFRERCGERPSVNLDDPDLRLNLHINQNIASLYLDSSGDSLHKRGYRTETNIAPLNELLAAGIIQLSGWDGQSPFMDGMCGSGTFLIEAALLARNIAPGVFRRQFGFERWKDYDAALYREVFREAESQERRDATCEIVGSDKDAQAVRFARQNVKNAGLEQSIRVDCKALEEQTPPAGPGVIIMNPPYGERMPIEQVNSFHRMIGETLKKKYSGWTAHILTGCPNAAERISLRPSRQRTFFNGQIECKLLEYRIR